MSNTKNSTMNRKIAVAGLAAAMCFSTGAVIANAPVKTEAAAYQYADFTGDGKVDLNDAKGVLKAALGIGNKPNEQAEKAGDVDYSGKIDLNDAKLILQFGLGIKKTSDYEKKDSTSTTTQPTVTTQPTTVTTPPTTTVVPVTPTPYNPGITAAPSVTKKPVATSIPLPTVTPGEAVTGTSISSVENGLNGADYDEETGIYTFTDANKTAKRGIHFSNPWAGKTSLKQSVTDALPKYLKLSDGTVKAVIKNSIVSSIDGTTVYGTAEIENDTVKVVSGGSVVMEGTQTDWNVGMLPVVAGNIDSKSNYIAEYKELYVRPQWSNGVSISFWCKYNWASATRSDGAPMLVIKNSNGCDTNPGGEFSKTGHTGDFAVMVRLNGGVSFEGDETGNCFRSYNNIAGVNGEWNYYTVTFANDWITVYVNGQELVYNEVEIDKDIVGFFNNGFLTRYNPMYQVTKEEVAETDIRNYLKKGWVSEQGDALSVLDKECCIIGNDRFAKPDAVTIKKNQTIPYDLLVDLLVNENTEIWFGSTSQTQCNCLTSEANTGTSKYALQSGTQLSDVTCYDKELAADEVAANYAKELNENLSKYQPSAE